MSKHAEQILNSALELPPMERAELIESLLTSFEFNSRKHIDALWAKESENRIDAFDNGDIMAVSAKEVFDKIEKKNK